VNATKPRTLNNEKGNIMTAKAKKKEVKKDEGQKYTFQVKGSKKDVTTVLKVNGKTKPFPIGKEAAFTLADLDMPKEIREIFTPLLGTNPVSTHLSVKKGYGHNHFGFTRSQVSWRGVFTYTDSQLCCHDWKGKITKEELLDWGKGLGLKVDRQGPNWVTWSFGPSNVADCIALGKKVLKSV